MSTGQTQSHSGLSEGNTEFQLSSHTSPHLYDSSQEHEEESGLELGSVLLIVGIVLLLCAIAYYVFTRILFKKGGRNYMSWKYMVPAGIVGLIGVCAGGYYGHKWWTKDGPSSRSAASPTAGGSVSTQSGNTTEAPANGK